MRAYVFSGQGSQKKGMGKELFDKFTALTEIADKVLGYSIKDLCLNDNDNLLDQTKYTQPAIYVVSVMEYLDKVCNDGVKPKYVAGHSLGEYAALFASGVFDFETGLKIVKKRGELMGQVHNGGMAAVVGLEKEEIKSIIEDNKLKNIEVANYNTRKQIVLSGDLEEIKASKKYFEEKGALKYVLLNVSGAFHSSYMRDAAKEFRSFLEGLELSKPSIPVISNYTADVYKEDELLDNMVKQMYSPVKWVDSIRYIMSQGVDEILQVGPGGVVKSLVRNIGREYKDVPFEAPKSNNVSKVFSTDNIEVKSSNVGSKKFKEKYNLKYPYVAGSMYKGISSKEMVVKMAKSHFMSFLGTGGVNVDKVEEDIKYIKSQLNDGEFFGSNLLCNVEKSYIEESLVDLYLKYDVNVVEASAYMSMNSALVRYRLKGLKKDNNGKIIIKNNIFAKISRPEVAEMFLSTPPSRIVKKLLEEKKITEEEAELSQSIPMADHITIEGDSGGHTDSANLWSLFPFIVLLRDEMKKKYNYENEVDLGIAGGIGTPDAIVSAFTMGADYIVTGSINQCTIEAATSDSVKNQLQSMKVQDTDYAPAADMFEFGAKVQVLKKGVFFPARAKKLYELYKQYDSIDDIDDKTKDQLQNKYFRKTFDEIFELCKEHYSKEEIERAEKSPKQKMVMIFKWYFAKATRFALDGVEERKVDYQVQCGPALGAFNQWVKGTDYEPWNARHVDEIAEKLMEAAIELLNVRINKIIIG